MARECARCLNVDDLPGVSIDASGVCSVCREYDRRWGSWAEGAPRRAQELQKLFALARARRARYDVVVPLSGGKDSTFVLYLAVRRFGLRALAVTVDNAFLSDDARDNIGRAVDALGADHVFFRPSPAAMRELYRKCFLKTGFFCVACMHAIDHTVVRAAMGWRVPLVLKGTCERTEEVVAPELFLPGDPNLFAAVTAGEPCAQTSGLDRRHELFRRVLLHVLGPRAVVRFSSGAIVNLPDYLDWDYDEIFASIQRELGWKAREASAEHSDCRAAPAVAWLRKLRCPAMAPDLPRYSKLASAGILSKEEALRRLHARPDGGEERALSAVLEELHVSPAQLEEVLAQPLRHLDYLRRARRSWRARLVSLAASAHSLLRQ